MLRYLRRSRMHHDFTVAERLVSRPASRIFPSQRRTFRQFLFGYENLR